MVTADPITTEVIRGGLNSAAEQMKRALIRTAFSPIITECYDLAVAIYDRECRLLAQALGLPIFMGTLNFCVTAAVAAVGGDQALEDGDILLYNIPYGSGSHPQDCAVVMPIFFEEELVGYSTLKAHWLDIAGKDPYSTDTVDVFQEGTIFPGVKLVKRGQLVDDIYRMAVANSRLPRSVGGDINAEVVGARTGTAAVQRILAQYGRETFDACVARMFEHGEATVRSYFGAVPDGDYVARAMMDSNGLDDIPVEFVVRVKVAGSDVTIDYSEAPDQQPGPINCPYPGTVSATRIAIGMLAGGTDAPNEGYFRPIKVVARPGSMFEPLPPAPCFLYCWPMFQAIDAIHRAIAKAMPDSVPAGSGGDNCSLVWWGQRERSGEAWTDGAPHPVGQGGHADGDGASSLIHVGESSTRFGPIEVWESRNPWVVETMELIPDSCGAGRHRGGLGVLFVFRMLEDAYVTTVVERMKMPPWGLDSGGEAAANKVVVRYPDGSITPPFGKVTRLALPKGTRLELHTGGGGGFGDPLDRTAEAVRNDIADGYITETYAARHHPNALGAPGGAGQTAETTSVTR
jgi:N-methylhydantoinase B